MRLRLLGEFGLAGATGVIAIPTKKNRALLAILALAPGQQATRERLCGLLWGDRAEEQARSSLRQSLAMLRKELGESYSASLLTVDDRVGLDPGLVTSDAAEFRRLADAGEHAASAALYGGEFLADSTLREEAFTDWLAAERRTLSNRAIRVFEALAESRPRPDRVLYGQRLLALDPLREASHRALMQAHAADGDRAQALKQFENCRDILRKELGVEPSAETAELRRRIASADNAASDQNTPVPAAAPVDQPSIAVKPFANLGEDRKQDFLADVTARDIVTELARFRQLKVMPHFQETGATPGQPRYCLEGGILRFGGRIRASVQLIDRTSGNAIWGEKYDRAEDELFALQDELVRAIVTTLAGRIQADLVENARRKPTSSLAAYECVMMADALNFRDHRSNEEARALCRKAIALDPNYARAHLLLAVLHYRRWLDHLETPDSELAETWPHAARALALDPADAFIHHALGEIHLWSGNFDLARYHADKAMSLNPSRPSHYTALAHIALYEGRTAEALKLYQRARELDQSFEPDWYWSTVGIIHYVARTYESALAAFIRVPDQRDWVEAYRAASLAQLGDMAMAGHHAGQVRKLNPGFTIDGCLARDPFRNPEDRRHVVNGMKLAGLPEKRPISKPEHGTKPAIAVLPFTNLSGDPEQQYLADGIAEDIITGLARFRHLAVVARNSSFRFRGDVDLAAAARDLKAEYIVEGSVRRIGDRLRITAQLIHCPANTHVWANAYDFAGADLFDVQDQVVRTIVATLGGRVVDASVHHARLKPPASLAAYELVLRANALDWESPAAKAEARQMLEAALRHDPNYATAHSLFAAVTLREAAYHGLLTMAVLDRALAHARTAVAIDANDSACHSILGWVLIARGEFGLAAEIIRQALQLNPNNAYAMINQGALLNQTGHPAEAIAWFEKVERSDPYFLPSWRREKLGFAYFTARRYAEAAEQLSRAAKLRYHMHALAAACHAKLGRPDAALAALLRALELRPDCTVQTILPLLPYERAEDRAHLVEALRLAGVPD